MSNHAIVVDKVSKVFKLPHERNTSVKSALINLVRGKKQTYERQQALKNVSFTIDHGEFFAIVGRNGSGKSTLLKLLAGIYVPTTGTVQVNGKLTPFIELGVGFNHELSGRENVYLNGALLGFSRKEMDAMYQDIVEFAELERFMDQKLKNYSSGMQVRLAFSIAIRAESDILLLDEVLAVGDAAFQQKCFNYFEELKQQKRTVVFVSHDMGAVRRFCTRAAYVNDGKLLQVGTPQEIADLYTVDNIERAQQAAASETGQPSASPYKITSKIAKQTDKTLVLELGYSSKTDEPMYLGLALMRDGTSFAEISTRDQKPLVGKGKVEYHLDLSQLNAGVYQVDTALFAEAGQKLLAFTTTKTKFVVKGADPTKGASLKLADNWKQV